MNNLDADGRKRPLGVTVIAVINILGAVFLAFFGLALVGLAGTDEDVIVGALIIVSAAVAAWWAVGLLRLRNWARITANVLYGAGGFLDVTLLLSGEGLALLWLICDLAVLVYLNSAHVRAAFSRQMQETNLPGVYETVEVEAVPDVQ